MRRSDNENAGSFVRTWNCDSAAAIAVLFRTLHHAYHAAAAACILFTYPSVHPQAVAGSIQYPMSFFHNIICPNAVRGLIKFPLLDNFSRYTVIRIIYIHFLHVWSSSLTSHLHLQFCKHHFLCYSVIFNPRTSSRTTLIFVFISLNSFITCYSTIVDLTCRLLYCTHLLLYP